MVSLEEEDAGAEQPLLSPGELNEVVVDSQGMEREVASLEESRDGGSPLLEACKKGRREDAWQKLRSKNPALSKENINHVDNDGATALMWAIAMGMEDVAIELVARGAKCDVVQSKDNSAKEEQGQEVIQQEDTPLILACYGGLNEIAMKLLKPKEGPQALSKEHINHKNLSGHTALDFAIWMDMDDVELKLRASLAGGHPLLAACKKGCEKEAIELLRIEDDINYVDEDGETALTYAIGNHMKDTALKLIRRGAKCDVVTKNGDTPLQMACRKKKEPEHPEAQGAGLPEVAKELLEHIDLEDLEHIDLVKPFDPRINFYTGYYALHHAIDSRMTDVALDLIRRGARCDVPTFHGDTPLGKACHNGLSEIAKELLKGSEEGGPGLTTEDINHKNCHGANPLCLAICSHNLDLEVMKMLIDRGGESENMLSLASRHSNDEFVVYLLTSANKNEQIDVINKEDHGRTPLEWAVKNHLSGATVELLKQGASLLKPAQPAQPGKPAQPGTTAQPGKPAQPCSIIEVKSDDFKTFLDELMTTDKFGSWSQKWAERLVFNYKFLFEGGYDNTPILDSIINLSPDHKELVKHPLVQAFLVEKWKKMLPMWRFWIILKIIFFGLIVVFASVLYTSSMPGTMESDAVLGQVEKEATKHSCQNLTLPDLFTVKTPPNATVTSMQVCFNTLTSETKIETPNSLESVSENWLLIIPQVTFGLLTLFFWCVELMQIFNSVKAWVTEMRNWLQLIILGISTYICFAMCLGSCPDLEMSHLIATLLPMVYYEGLYEVGYHYKFSKYINMFNRVLKTFCRYFLAYIGLIVCFAGGKAIMLPPPKEDNFPSTFWALLPKMFVMLTGEQEFMNIPFTSSVGYRAWETMYFLVFLMLTVVILLNMLNGLAVADAQEMLDESERDSLCSLLSTAAFWVRYVGKQEESEEEGVEPREYNCCTQFANLRVIWAKMKKWRNEAIKKYAGVMDKDKDTDKYYFAIYDDENLSTFTGYKIVGCKSCYSKSTETVCRCEKTDFTIDNDVKNRALELIRNKISKKQEKEEKEAEKEERKRIFDMLQAWTKSQR